MSGAAVKDDPPWSLAAAPVRPSDWTFLRVQIPTLAHPMGDCRPSLARVEFHSESGVRKVQWPWRVLAPGGVGDVRRSMLKIGESIAQETMPGGEEIPQVPGGAS